MIEPGPSLDQGQLLVLVVSILLQFLASSMPGSAEGQGDTPLLSTVLVTVVLERVVGGPIRSRARRAASDMLCHPTHPPMERNWKKPSLDTKSSEDFLQFVSM